MITEISSRAVNEALDLLTKAERARNVSGSAAKNIQSWLSEDRYAEYVAEVIKHIQDGNWATLDDVFWTVIPFGTGGRRGKMYPIGCNAINDRTIGESAQGLAEYILDQVAPPHSCAIAYDTRHQSDHFARLCAEILAAAGFDIYFLDAFRSTPELSCTIRQFHCTCGIMVTASHNPPSDNAVKVYWSTGGQLLPPHDSGVIDRVMRVGAIRRMPWDEAVSSGKVRRCTQEADEFYLAAVLRERLDGPRDLHVVYSPLHGVGSASVVPVLERDGFKNVEVYPRHAEPNGDFPNVPANVANPENVAVFDDLIRFAKDRGADLILATDPDCDRLGCAVPKTCDSTGDWQVLNGNQIGVLLTNYVLSQKKRQKSLNKGYVVKTLVTTEMIRRIAEEYAVRVFGDLHVGFKWIAGTMDAEGPEGFLLGAEESHGYLVGQYARDKDGAVAAMLLAELAAQLKKEKCSLPERLDALYLEHGYHAERLINVQMPGSSGMARMTELMAQVRTRPPHTLAGMPVRKIRDYEELRMRTLDGTSQTLSGTRGDLVILDLDPAGNAVALRPSGTEPKIKFYLFGFEAPENISDLSVTKERVQNRLIALDRDLRTWCDGTRD
jgi:phosphoglucomutase/phosphomannomutase